MTAFVLFSCTACGTSRTCGRFHRAADVVVDNREPWLHCLKCGKVARHEYAGLTSRNIESAARGSELELLQERV